MTPERELLREALKLAHEFVADPDKRAQVKVQLAMNGRPKLADMIDEAVRVSRALIALANAQPEASHQAVLDAYTRCADQVPSTWLDPLLSGSDAVILGGSDGKEIEALLSAVRKRILAARDALKGKP